MQPGCNNDTIAASPGRRSVLDRIGIGVSLACAIHCVLAALLAAAPAFAATAAPGLGEGFEWLETALLWIALGVGAFALVPAYLREHRSAWPLVLFVVGLGFVAAVRTVDSHVLELVGTVSGVALIASAHLVNLRASHRGHAH
ncbi:MerC domain-containing protein [Sandaracinus amylolyticus]|uniref:MerC domain-containing protein n=1 Tax=Sandaracinus amylolyticus TaxID=927083 RepID=A0A0F6SE60_9BACT|nr:MerC domain-containing protein [Sandaracinus amylolyticus]AKF04629.1 hypothetical protein DB32_001778 [Sandaracinus amylolyticus]